MVAVASGTSSAEWISAADDSEPESFGLGQHGGKQPDRAVETPHIVPVAAARVRLHFYKSP